ncbi:MAG: hypothetical protein IKJ59_14995 [Clostridia bacterium]|nr:hypothetical protein [Clostridia bacterium]
MAQFTNQAQLSYNNSVTNSNIAVGEILEVLSATKTAVMDDYVRNDDITYIVSIVNSGTASFTGLTLTDNLGAYPWNETSLVPLTYVENSARYYVNGILQPAPTVEATEAALIISGLNIPAGGNAIIVYEAEANQFAPLDVEGTITNTATISGIGLSSTITATETVYTEDVPELTITKSVSPVPVSENGILTYTFIIQNSGNTAADASSNVVITDTFDPILSNLTVTLDGVTLPSTSYTYNETTGEFATVAGSITVPAATYTQSATEGFYIINPGVTTLTISGTV